jgi:hypothetical protein
LCSGGRSQALCFLEILGRLLNVTLIAARNATVVESDGIVRLQPDRLAVITSGFRRGRLDVILCIAPSGSP